MGNEFMLNEIMEKGQSQEWDSDTIGGKEEYTTTPSLI